METPPPTATPAQGESGFSSPEPNGERRRRQLIRAAAHIVEYEGLDALKMPRVAELAGCARTLVYRYFPSREHLLRAIASEYYAALVERFDRERQRRMAHGEELSADPLAASLDQLALVFEVVTEFGLAGLLLRSSPNLNPQMREHIATLTSRLAERWIEPVRAAGLSDLHAAVLTEAGAALMVDVVQRWQKGDLSREEALALTRTLFRAMLEALVNGSQR